MADTNDLKVIVSLDIGKSAIEIEKDLPILEKLLASKDSGKLKIVGQLDTDVTKETIESQLSSLKVDGSKLKITPQLDVSKINSNNAFQPIVQKIDETNVTIQSVIDKAISKLKEFDPNSIIGVGRLEQLKEEISRTFSTDEIKVFSDALDQIVTKNGFNAWRDGIKTVNAESSKLNQVFQMLTETIQGQYVTSVKASEEVVNGLTNQEKALKTLQNYFKEIQSSESSGKELVKWLDTKQIDIYGNKVKGIKNDFESIIPVLNGLSANYEKFISYSSTLGLDTLALQDGVERADVDGKSKALNQFFKTLSKVREEENATAVEYNKLIETISSQYGIVPQNGQIQLTLAQLKEICTTIPNAEKYLGGFRDALEKTIFISSSNTNGSSKAFQNIQDSANTTRKTIQDLRNDLLDIDKTKANFRFKAGVNDNGEDLKKTLENARKLFSAYKDIDDIQFKWSADESGEVNKISAIIKSVIGQVETLRFELQQTNGVYNDVFAFVGSSSGDTGIAKATKEAEKLAIKTEETRTKYTRLLEEFKSSNSDIQSGLTNPIKEFEDVLKGLGTTHSISDVINQFEKLKTSAAEISQYLNTTNNSFNKNTNAINNYNQMDDAIKRIEASYGNLTVKNDKLGESVTNLRSMYEALVVTEKEQGGTTVTWAQEYQKVNAVLKEVKTNIEAAVRAESSSKEADKNSQYQIQARHLKSIVEAQKQIVQLSRQRLSADEAETAELDRQIKNARQRVRDNTKYLIDKDLYSGIAKQIADSSKAIDEQLKLIGAKQTDSIKRNYQDMSSAIDRAVEKLKTLQSQPLFKTEGDSGITKLSTDITTLVRDYEKLQKSMMKSTPNSQNLDHYAEKLVEIDQRAKAIRTTFDTVKGSIAEATKAYSNIERSMSRLDTISGTKIFKDFSSSEEVKQLQDRISQLKKEYQDTFNALKQSDVGSAQFKDALINLDALDAKMKELVVDTKGTRDALNNAKGTTAFEKQVASLTNSINNLQKATSLTDNQRNALSGLLNRTELAQDKAALEQILVELTRLRGEIEQTGTESKNFDQISKSVEKVITDLGTMSRTQIFNTHSNNADVIEFQGKINSLSDTAKQVKADLNALGDSKAIPPELKSRVDNLTESFKELEGSNETLQANLRQNDAWTRTERQIQTLTARVKEYMAVNTKAAKKYSGQFDGLLSGLSQAEMNKDSEAVRRLSADFQILRSQIKAAGDTGKTLGQMIVDNAKKFSMWFSLTSNIMRAWRTLKQMVTTVKELDTAMTALKRVTDETESSYAKFLKNIQTQAVKLHATMTDLIDQITTWSKLGYSLEESQKLAEVSMMYSKVGDVDNETAVKDLVATMKAYNMTAEESIRIVDMLDLLNNKYAVSAKDLGSGLSKVASAMAVSNTSLEKSLSLITGGAEITQDVEGVSTALKVINARIRGMKGQLQELGEEYENVESISKIQTQILNLAGVNIFDANRNFRDTYDILEDIAKVYKELPDEKSSNLLEILFGKNRYNQGVAFLQAFESGQIQKALKDVSNSAGTASEEWSKYEKSIDASVASFNAMKQALSSEIFNSQDLKNIVDFGTNALGVLKDIISQFGVIQTLLPIIMGSLSAFKNVGRAKMSALKMEYADCNVVVTRNELMIA